MYTNTIIGDRKIVMSKIKNFIKQDIETNPSLKEEYKQISTSLDLAILLRQKRDKLGMTRKEFAEYLEVSESIIKNIEAETIKAPANLISKIVNITK